MAPGSRSGITAPLTMLDAAREFVWRGWAVVPVPQGKKAPQIPGWPSLRLGEADLPKYFNHGENIGVILGQASNGLADVDLDTIEAVSLAPHFLPYTELVHGRASKPSSHFWYIAPGASPKKFTDLNGTPLVEIRSTGQQTIAPPSVHPSGEVLAWDRDGEPVTVDGAELLRAVARLATAALFVRHWPVGSRHHAANALAGMLLRAGWSEEDAVLFVGVVAEAAHDEETKSRVCDVVTTAKRLAAGKSATGTPTLAEIVGGDIVSRAREWLGMHGHRDVEPADSGWPTPAPLGDELLSVPSFDLELLPSSLRPLVEDISERMQAPPDYAAAAAIVALAGCVNRRAVIIPKCEDTSWSVVPNLWGAIVAPPGMMKSPIFHAVTLPLARIEDRWRAKYERAAADFEVEREQVDLRSQAWREQFKVAAKRGEPGPARPDRTLGDPTQRRLVLTDATFEKLHHILSQNPAGVLVLRDELTGWLSELGRQGREGERGFFLQAWNGDGGFTVDRIGRGSIHVSAVCVSLLGNIQPARLRAYLSDAIEGGPTDDGLFQRFQILVWPDLPRDWRLVDRPANQTALETAERVFSNLAELAADDPLRMSFAPEAQLLFFDWLGGLERKVRGDSSLAPALVAHLAKYRSLMPTLAGLFELADREAHGDVPTGAALIALDQAGRAAAFCDYLEAHARRVYGSVISPETRAARELARHIHAGDLSSPFTTRVAYLKGWTGLDSPERVRAALALLEEAGWVRRAEGQPSPTGGRPSEVWLVNPKVERAREK